MKSPEQMQQKYYADTAAEYDKMHGSEDEHAAALGYMLAFMRFLNATSVLDVGCGTGRAVRYFAQAGLDVHGIEPVPELIEQAVASGISSDLLSCGSGAALPFPDSSFDVVCEVAVLHHVRLPDSVISEMMRVARKAIFLSDSNRFGQGPIGVRLLKLGLYKAGLWPYANWIRTRCKGYEMSSGDGISYSYSVYDSLEQLAPWARRIHLLATTDAKVSSWIHPLLTSRHVLVCAERAI